MFVRPPVARSSRNPGRRPIPPRPTPNEINRPLLRQFIRNRRSEPRYEAYIIEVREGPAVNGNTNAAAGKSIPQPWVTVRDFVRANQSIGLPVSVCDTLLKHLLTCVSNEEARTRTDSSEESEIACESPRPASAADGPSTSPARASGDMKSQNEEATSDENSPAKKSPLRPQSKLFQLSQLQPIRIVCDATGCTLEVIARDPTAKRVANNPDEPDTLPPIDPCRRWIVSAPLETGVGAKVNSEQTADSTSGGNGRRKNPWETRGVLELHESLMPQLSAFLTDVVTRYRSVDQLPEVRSLYSASGGRRFFFDLRDTRWGKRLHISQVTDLHRNVIGIPLEALVSFRTRLDTVIKSLGLDDQHALRSEFYGPVTDSSSPRGQRPNLSSRDRSNDVSESAKATDEGNRDTVGAANRNDVPQNRQRGRRRQRVRSFTSGVTGAGGSMAGNRPAELAGTLAESNSRRSLQSSQNQVVGSNQWNGGIPRNRRFGRRNRNPRPFNRGNREPPAEADGESNEANLHSTSIQSAPEPIIDSNRVAPVAQASA